MITPVALLLIAPASESVPPAATLITALLFSVFAVPCKVEPAPTAIPPEPALLVITVAVNVSPAETVTRPVLPCVNDPVDVKLPAVVIAPAPDVSIFAVVDGASAPYVAAVRASKKVPPTLYTTVPACEWPSCSVKLCKLNVKAPAPALIEPVLVRLPDIPPSVVKAPLVELVIAPLLVNDVVKLVAP